jgi:hypothetical protein
MPKSNLKENKSVEKKVKIPVTFKQHQLCLIEDFTGIMGNTKAEIIRNIVINWLLQHPKSKEESKT